MSYETGTMHTRPGGEPVVGSRSLFLAYMARHYLRPESEPSCSPSDTGRCPSTDLPIEPGQAPPNPQWPDLVHRIRVGDPAGMEELYRVFSDGIRHYLR